jgi:pimeloyl-ACP methyl ester carboxylesterase
MSYLVLCLLLFAGLALLLAAVAIFATHLALRPPRMSDGKAIVRLRRLSPGDLGLEYENVRFDVPDDFTNSPIRIAGWWIAAERPTDRCVIILHGFSDAKVGGIAWAPMWRELGWNVLAIDLRAHGESGGKYCTAGWYEGHDVSHVIDELRRRRPDQSRRIILFGASLGAAVAAAVGALRDDLEAVIMDCPYSDFRRAALTHARVWGMPEGRMTRMVMWLAQKIARADFAAVRPVDLVGRIPCPLVVIRCGRDFLVDPDDDAQIRAALQRRAEEGKPTLYWTIPEAEHILGLAARPEEYMRMIQEFIERASPAGNAGNGCSNFSADSVTCPDEPENRGISER